MADEVGSVSWYAVALIDAPIWLGRSGDLSILAGLSCSVDDVDENAEFSNRDNCYLRPSDHQRCVVKLLSELDFGDLVQYQLFSPIEELQFSEGRSQRGPWDEFTGISA